jgi:hypothetical protein
MMEFNNDLLMVAFNQLHQPAGSTGRITTNFCDFQRTGLTTSDVDLLTNSSITGMDKCTYILVSPAGKAPGFKLTTVGWRDWQLFWIEASDDSVATGGFMTTITATPFFMGPFTSTLGPFLNPQKRAAVTGWPTNADSYTDYYDPSIYPPGFIGEVIYYPIKVGPL